MAYEESLKSISLDADVTIGIYTGVPGMPGSTNPNGGKQYCFVEITAAHTVGLAEAGGTAIGVLQNKPQHVGDPATVGIFGVSYVVAGDDLAFGENVSSDVDGAGIPTTSTNAVLGRVIIGAAVGELATVLLKG